MNNKVIILDFGSQYTQLIARRVREMNIFCEILPYNKKVDLDSDVKAVILSGSPFSVTQKEALHPRLNDFVGKLPVLGICYGAQYIANHFGGKVEPSLAREYGKSELIFNFEDADRLLSGVDNESQVWMSHADTIIELPKGFDVIARTNQIPVAAFVSNDLELEYPIYCLQFHPEVTHSLQGIDIIKNFLVNIAGISQSWTPESFVDSTIVGLKEKLRDEAVILGLSGGVDSTVAAMLLHRAIGDKLYCIFVDNGLLRQGEFESVLQGYKGLGLNVKGVNAAQDFLSALEGVSDPEGKRKIIGRVFIEVFERESNAIPEAKWLGQGTIYPDVIESVSVHGPSVTIKSHHNVGGLPDKLKLNVVEPLRELFKDEVRRVGTALGLSQKLLGRHPFPGPGLAIRILGEVTNEKVDMLQKADAIFINKLHDYDVYDEVWQAGAILLPVQSVGVMGDERTYEQAVALRAVSSVDGMTAEWSKLPYDLLADVSTTIINQVKGINRVVYDISTKPPATIEWE